MEEESWIAETLKRAGWPVDAEVMPFLRPMVEAFRSQLQRLDDPVVVAMPPEVGLDPSRAPTVR